MKISFFDFSVFSTIPAIVNDISLEQSIESLLALNSSSFKTKGSSFPQIRGPNKKDKICIVGAGPAGIHMAAQLKNKNFENIKIFEATNRVGGKSFDMFVEGYYRPLGTVFLGVDYFENVIQFAKQYLSGDLVPVQYPGVSKIIIENRHMLIISCPIILISHDKLYTPINIDMD